ncbi:MAG: hypothetical protein IT371_06805 [Deltaproteobacteria bacterium]|nr:hypothetical protein [Deltaproteobacteria bacterium]
MTTFVLRAAVCVTAIAVSSSAFARGGGLDEQLAEAKRQYSRQEYEAAIQLVTRIVQSPAATSSQKTDALELEGLSHLILGDADRAKVAFERLLRLDPAHILRDPSGSPKLRQFFEQVKETLVPDYRRGAPVEVDHAAPAGAAAGRPVEFVVRVGRGLSQVKGGVLWWRRVGGGAYAELRLALDARRLTGAFLLPEDESAYTVEYYVEVRGKDGVVLARVGEPQRPLVVQARGLGAGEVRRPVYKRWWFWTALGVAAAGGATAAAVLLGQRSAPRGNLEPGIIQLP